MATNSLLLRAWKSFQVKSLSLVSGALAVSTYLNTSCLPSKSLRYSCSHTAQFRDVDILSPSKFRNSFAGTLSGKIYDPSALSMAGNTMQWKTMLSLPMKWTRRVSLSFHHFSQSSGNNSLVLLIYPIGASNQTYSTLPSAPSTGTGIPQSKSRLTARGCKPVSSQLLHCP